ncbi:MAG: peptidyl-prolyl cis-trans isomerase [Deltaproteobacteria bacterium]|nr:peptidyl-prolyl cis-trans isomerase [Deltaproteobacteria bacterium]
MPREAGLRDAARLGLFVIGLAAAAASGPACRRSTPSATCQPDGETVACVDGVALRRAYVEQFVQEPWWKPGSSVLPDPRQQAVERALRTALFHAEAKRRRLTLPAGTPDVPASWAQALVADEMARRGVTRASISDDEAARHYEQNKELFNQVDEVDAQVIAFTDPKLAEQVYLEAAKADTEGFRALAAKHSVDEKTKDKGGDRRIIAAPDEDQSLLKMALSLRKPGVVGGPFRGTDGRWYLLRIKASPLEHAKPLDDVMRTTVKNALLDQRRRQVMEDLDLALRSKAKIELFDAAIGKITVPPFK